MDTPSEMPWKFSMDIGYYNIIFPARYYCYFENLLPDVYLANKYNTV